MPVIAEDEVSSFSNADFAQLLELPDHTFNTSEDVFLGTTTAGDVSITCPTHPDTVDCACNSYIGDWDLPTLSVDPVADDLEEPDYSKLENWIPCFFLPESPCDYCRSRKLNCYIQRGEAFCTPCNALFRECSLTKSNTLEANNYVDQDNGTFLDTLHAVDEDVVKQNGTFTVVKPLNSRDRRSGTSTLLRLDDAPGSSKRNGIRFPRHAVKILRDWLEAHADDPYPTEAEKVELESQTELKPSQIANWLANARRRRRASEKTKPRLCASPSLRPSSPAIAIPNGSDKSWNELNPFERWKNSPPEHEPALLTDIIANAENRCDLRDDVVSTTPSTLSKRGKRSSNGSNLSNVRAPSLTSQETGQTSSLSASSAAFSHGSSNSRSTHGSFGSFSSSLAGKKDRRRRRRPVTLAPGRKLSDDNKKRIFQCTFCTDTFKSKYDWTRHEKSLHLSLEKWICAPLGPVITDQATGNQKCVYCDQQKPSSEHVESHNHRQCEEKGLDARTFYRKDHLRQHMRLMHGCEMTTFTEKWKFTAVSINSRCGFCSRRFSMWQERNDHLTAHFKAGSRMSEWKGCRGLDPAVVAQVTNAMPPYLIGIESLSPNPFSASNRASWRQAVAADVSPDNDELHQGYQIGSGDMCEPGGSKSTCWEILTVRLGNFAKLMARKGEIMTDDMLQAQARRILYDSDDTWNQTAADNPEWLDLFKKAHGLDFIPNAVGGQGLSVPDDLETYGDLGLRIPFAVQLHAYNQSQQKAQSANTANVPGPFTQVLEQRKVAFEEVYAQLAREGVLHADDQPCEHPECLPNVIDMNTMNPSLISEFQPKRWCSHDITNEKAAELKGIVARGNAGSPIEQEGVSENTLPPDLLAYLNVAGKALNNEGCPRAGNAAYQEITVGKSLPRQQAADPALIAARARAQDLAALSRVEGPLTDDCMPRSTLSNAHACKKPCLPRHRYELPADRAQRFQTITGAWQDSGDMPEPIETSLPSLEMPFTTSTGAMMEFLGGEIGSTLPFSNDALTSNIPMPDFDLSGERMPDFAWAFPGNGTTGDDVAMQQLDDLIAPSTAVDFTSLHDTAMDMPIDTNWTSAEVPTTGHEMAELPTDVGMEDFNFDDLTFDGVFDMPLDETFDLGAGGG